MIVLYASYYCMKKNATIFFADQSTLKDYIEK